MTKIAVLTGSTRIGSINRKLSHLAVEGLKARGADVTDIDLKNYDMPLYNGDIEERDGQPQAAKELSALLTAQNGVFIAAPEYNASMTPLLKNTLDWVSRTRHDKSLRPFLNPIYALGAVSDGGFGGYRGLIALRHMLELGVQARVLPDMASVKHANKAFDETGRLIDETAAKMLARCLDLLMETARPR